MYSGLFFAIIGVAVWLGAYQLSGFGAAVLSQLALFIARKTSLVIRAATSKVIGPVPLATIEKLADAREAKI